MQGPKELATEFLENHPYTGGMARKLSKARPRQGAFLAQLRTDAGLSQAELGRLIGETQQNVAFWEQSDKPPRSDVLPKMAKVLGVSVDEILNAKEKTSGLRRRPTGKTQMLFEELAMLPRRQQDKIIDVITAMVEQYRRKAG